ncbi:MAG: Calcineurin-like phosphoesterase, partial [Bacteroidetes bacterium]|nr:Calcineurin-like phosphoesterase [Bacteroidota bacterium]
KGEEQDRWRNALASLANLLVALAVFLPTQQSLVWTIAIAGGLRILGTAWDLVTAPVYGTADAGDTVLRDLGIADDPAVRAAVDRMVAEEQARRPIDLAWILTFILTLMAIHIGRMESEWTLA